MERREFARKGGRLAAAAAGIATAMPQVSYSQQDQKKPQTSAAATGHLMMPEKPEEIAMLIYPGMTALDLIGPQQVFGFLMGARVHLVAKTSSLVVSDTGVAIQPSKTFENCPDPVDVLCVPGGALGTISLMKDKATLEFLASRGRTANWVTSVCTGSLLLAAAGLLKGYKATSHWPIREVLADFGATPVAERVVEDRNRITAGGVTSGIDFGLRLAAKLRGVPYAQSLELALEYDPQPPFGAGTPAKAPPEVVETMRAMYAPLVAAARSAAKPDGK